ncbi:7-cyano-7-deazaguanine synthase (queuosine biosynthesis) [Planococcus glaciei]|uniref:hypothetical protein n=1 Tax=Planococcus glaciei TaxID=459472 RepID=UPI00088FBB23|nr:hypothetical protein [Planococcus glaciei]SDH54257.1 7-cyano-7-deazaguanine synthase (queuosine biosynthesis) [Planococcus glaciei]
MVIVQKINEDLHASLLDSFPYDYNNPKHLKVIDLVTVMGSIYVADVTTTSRKEIRVVIPVFNYDRWTLIEKEVNQLVQWVSGENFVISFIHREHSLFTNIPNHKLELSTNNPVTLFSGGLDSLTGAYRNYKDNIKSDYLGFINKSEEKTHQEILKDFYLSIFKGIEITLIHKPVPKKKHLTQATRSLLYFALAVAKCIFNNSSDVYLYENGILSLNPEINNRFTTKTTHPRTLYMYRSILEKVELKVTLHHPFIFKTKGESIEEMDDAFKNQIKDSFTCGAGRSNLKPHKGQCGVCIPCLLRKISMAAYNNEAFDSKYFVEYNTKVKEVKDDLHRKELLSNLNYFEKYCEYISKGTINIETRIKESFYMDQNYLKENQKMFRKFQEEFERYMKKYDPY